MKKNHLLFLFLVSTFLGLSLGCSEDTQSEVNETYEDTTANVQEGAEAAEDWLKNTWSNVSEFSVEQKNTFVSTMQSTTSKMNAEAESLTRNAEDISEETMDSFQKATGQLEDQLEKAANASEEGWESTKQGVKNAWDRAVDSYQNLQAEAES